MSATYEELLQRAEYAKRSHSVTQVYETFGAAKMARELNAITKDEFFRLNEILVRDGLNNGFWMRQAERRDRI